MADKVVSDRLMLNNGSVEAAAPRVYEEFSGKQKCTRCGKRFVAFLLSTVGLTFSMIAYTLFGGLLFSEIEAPYEQREKDKVRNILRNELRFDSEKL